MQPQAHTLACFVWQDARPLRGLAGILDWEMCGFLSEALRGEQFRGLWRESLLVGGRPYVGAQWIVLVGLGNLGAFSKERAQEALCQMVELVRGLVPTDVQIELPGRDRDRLSLDIAKPMLANLCDTDRDRWTIIDRSESLSIR